MSARKITRALISVFYKDRLEPIINLLGKHGVEFVSTGGTQEFIEKLGFSVTPVETLTGYPSIFGGRVKTLHPVVFWRNFVQTGGWDRLEAGKGF